MRYFFTKNIIDKVLSYKKPYINFDWNFSTYILHELLVCQIFFSCFNVYFQICTPIKVTLVFFISSSSPKSLLCKNEPKREKPKTLISKKLYKYSTWHKVKSHLPQSLYLLSSFYFAYCIT